MNEQGPLEPLQEPSAVLVEPHEESSAEAVLAEQLIAAAPLFIP